jgi:hypothetical protein
MRILIEQHGVTGSICNRILTRLLIQPVGMVDRVLFPQQIGGSTRQRPDGRVDAIDVSTDFGIRFGGAHVGGGPAARVAAEVDPLESPELVNRRRHATLEGRDKIVRHEEAQCFPQGFGLRPADRDLEAPLRLRPQGISLGELGAAVCCEGD